MREPVIDRNNCTDPQPSTEPCVRKSCWRGEGSIVRVMGIKSITRESTEAAILVSKLTVWIGSYPFILHETNLGPLHMCDCCIAWPTCGTPSSGSWASSWCFGRLLGTYSTYSVALSSLNTGEEVSPTWIWYAILCCHPWEVCPFLNKNGGGVDSEVGGIGNIGGGKLWLGYKLNG